MSGTQKIRFGNKLNITYALHLRRFTNKTLLAYGCFFEVLIAKLSISVVKALSSVEMADRFRDKQYMKSTNQEQFQSSRSTPTICFYEYLL